VQFVTAYTQRVVEVWAGPAAYPSSEIEKLCTRTFGIAASYAATSIELCQTILTPPATSSPRPRCGNAYSYRRDGAPELMDLRSRRVGVTTPQILAHQRHANLMQFQGSP
jgi:hypothetical protein